MGLISYIAPKKAAPQPPTPIPSSSLTTKASTPIMSPLMSPVMSSAVSVADSSFQDLKCDIMIEYLHQQQEQLRWCTPGGYDEGVVMKRGRDNYICCPIEMEQIQGGLRDHIQALNVKVAMTVITPVIRRFAGRSVVALSNGQQIQVLPDISYLSRCQKYQSAAFISDAGMLVVWDDEPTAIIERVSRLEKELLAMIWHAETEFDLEMNEKKGTATINESEVDSSDSSVHDSEVGPKPSSYKTHILSSFSEGLALALGFAALGTGVKKLFIEAAYTGSYIRFALLVTLPFSLWAGLFFFQVVASTFVKLLGPIKQIQENSKFYSGTRPQRLTRHATGGLPHVTIQMPVYKEGLEAVIVPTIRSIKAAMATYEMQGGSANIFINDDGMQLISPDDARARADFYEENNIGWVARPKHNPRPGPGEGEPFVRRGKFKKASNMNYAMWVSTRVEEKLAQLDEKMWSEKDAYSHALNEIISEDQGRTWAQGNVRMGDYILIIDSDTRVPKDCLLDSVSELEHTPQCGILQHASGVMNVTDSYFEKGITFFTNMVYTEIKYAVASGDIAPFVGHNAFLRWSAIQYIGYHSEEDNREKWWSEETVSEDFDMALRLQAAGYLVRLAGFASPDGELFEEGVSLTVYDELTRWEKYAYGCSELMFHPLKDWFHRGPFTKLFRQFIGSRIPLSSKFSLMAYIGTYYAIAATWLLTVANYFIQGWYIFNLDHFYNSSFNLWVAIVVVFSGVGNITLAVIRFRGEGKPLLGSLWENYKHVPMFFIFMGGISMHVSQAILSHMFSIDMSWGSTAKEVSNTTFFDELPLVIKRFKFTFAFTILMMAAMIVLGVAVPEEWRIVHFTAIWPLVTVVGSHFLLPIVLNPSLMLFTW